MTDAWVRLGVIARAHGVRGALKLKLENPDGRTLRKGVVVRVRPAPDAKVQHAQAQGATEHRVASYAASVLTLEDVVDRDGADALRGAELSVRRADFPDADLYLVDLVGAPVVDEAGAVLGHVSSFIDRAKQPLMIVKRARDEVSVPYVAALVLEASPTRVVLRPPPGLFDDDAIEVEPSADAAVDSDESDESDAAGDR